MPRFAAHFGLNFEQAQLDFVDVDTDHDLPVYLDPYAFSKRADPLSVACHEQIITFFEASIDAIRSGREERARELLNHLHEPNETCLGVSKGPPSGRGLGSELSGDLFEMLRDSRATQSGLLSDLEECELFVRGIGPDMISDITTNIARRNLVGYTQAQCELYGIPLTEVAFGPFWNPASLTWTNDYARLPVINARPILLVPKAFVRWSTAFSPETYYNRFVLEFLQAEHLDQQTALVETLKNGRQRVTKTRLEEVYPKSKDFLSTFTEQHPGVLAEYRESLGTPVEIANSELVEGFDETAFATILKRALRQIPVGAAQASTYHRFCMGLLEFIFYPHLIYPQLEQEIHEGRKRIDIFYDNASSAGFFFAQRTNPDVNAVFVPVECKNYSAEASNPELDQLAGRFSPHRGRLGFLMVRRLDDEPRFLQRCKDTVSDHRGYIISLTDNDIEHLLTLIEQDRRFEIDPWLRGRFRDLVT